MSKTGLFAPGAAHVWTVPAGTDFLGALARTLAEETDLASNPAALADGLIYVPNRRSARALALALHKEAGGKTILPPDIRALGDLEVDEPPSGAEEALTDLGPALAPARRLGTLAMLVTQFYTKRGIPLPPISAIAAARELGRLLDSAALSGDVDWSALPDLVQDTDLAGHWVDSVEFLRIVTEVWPLWLKENGATEPFARRLVVSHAIAASLRAKAPKGPFIIAGSTGATPASRALMQAAMQLPQGLVVLPGLDRDAPPAMWTEITERSEDKFPGEPDHPQFSLAGTLHALNLTASEVPVWPGIATDERKDARRRLIHESLAPASQTADWLERLKDMAGEGNEASFAKQALSGLTVLEAADEAEEALLAALALRQTLETPGQTAALITPDAGLARQVSAVLKRWNVNVPPSGGIPLGRTQSGALALLALDWARDTGHPVALAALLKHPLVKVDPAHISLLETSYLRGTRRWGDLQNLLASLPARTKAANTSHHTELPSEAEPAATALLTPLAPIASTAGLFADDTRNISGAAATEALVRIINALVGDETSAWSGRAGEAISKCVEAVREVTSQLQDLTPSAFADIFESLAAAVTVAEPTISHPRLSIWGPLEARLQQADRIVLAGLNEDIWPDRPPADAFLPRRFRAPLGLAAPEARLGLAAHDFAQLATAPDVLMLYAARREDAPAVASRWILRLRTLAEGALGQAGARKALNPPDSQDLRAWAAALTGDNATSDPKQTEPRPSPPVHARPKHLSVTRINMLQRDPYTIYASDILSLKKLDPLDAPLDARPRGTAIHAALEDFDTAPPARQTAQALHEAFLQKLREVGEPEHLIAATRATLARTAEAYLDWWSTRKPDIVQAWPEVRGTYKLTIAGEPFTLSGIADRIEQHRDGTYTIIDFKTGKGKTRKQLESGFEQQLPLLSVISTHGNMKGILQAPVGDFGYVSVRASFEAPKLTKGPDDARELADTSLDILTRLIEAYRQPEAVYLSIPRVAVKSEYDGDYDRLARRAEWAGDTTQGDA